MKPEEVLDNINNKILIQGRRNGKYLERETMKVIIEALEKQIPKVYDIRCNADGVCYDCPDCGIKINRYTNYCHHCGQKINWEESP